MYIYTYGYMVTYVCIPYNSRCANYSFHAYIHTQGIKSFHIGSSTTLACIKWILNKIVPN